MNENRQPSQRQAQFMAKVFVISTLLGMLVVFLNVTFRSYHLRKQQAELNSKGMVPQQSESQKLPTLP